MKPLNSNIKIQTNTNTDFQFTIKTSPHAFKILSDSLYSNKIMAVVREYLTNALDAHRASGKLETPIEITIPFLDHEWSVRDFGTGLSQEQIQELFCTYFSSSKTETNEQTGMLGLGCKSGFAYTSQFSVTSWFNGIKTMYQVYLDDGIPNVSIINSGPSNESSGLKVTLPTKENDEYLFKTYTHKVLEWFPESVIPDNIEIKTVDTKEFNYFCFHDTPGVVMGSVLYPMPEEYIKKVRNLIYKKAGELDKTVYFHKSIVFKADLGTLNVLPSREGLSLDKKTKANLEKLINKGLNETFQYIFEQCKQNNLKSYNKIKTKNFSISNSKTLVNKIKAELTIKERDNTSKIPANIHRGTYLTCLNADTDYILIKKNEKRCNKYNKPINACIKEDKCNLYIYTCKSNTQKKKLHRLLKHKYSNKIFFSEQSLAEYLYPEGLPQTEKRTKSSTKKAVPGAIYEIIEINKNSENTVVNKTLKEILNDYPTDTVFVTHKRSQLNLVIPKVIIVNARLAGFLRNKRNVVDDVSALINKTLSEHYPKETLFAILLHWLSSDTSYAWLDVKNNSDYELFPSSHAYNSSWYNIYTPSLYKAKYFMLGTLNFYSLGIEFIRKYLKRRLIQFFKSLGYTDLINLLQDENVRNIKPILTDLVAYKKAEDSFIKFLEKITDELFEFKSIKENRPVPIK